MKRKLLMAAIVAVASVIGGGSSAFAQGNIIKNWDGGSNPGNPASFGWSSSKSDRTFGNQDADGGVRFTTKYSNYKLEDGTPYTYSAGSEPSSKVFWIRYNKTENEVYTYTFEGLEAGETYVFSGLVGWHNNDTNPTFTIKIEGNEGTEPYETISKRITTKTTLYPVSATFTVPEDDASTQFTLNFTGTYDGTANNDCMEAISALAIYTELEYAQKELQAAIDNIEQNLGFEAGEYAPYNVPFETLNKAKSATELNEMVELTEELRAVKANEVEVNAIFDGSFEHDYSGQSGNIQPIGWYRNSDKTTGDGYNVRLMADASGNAGLNATSSKKALFTKFSAYYGYDEQYSMPLKANTYYSLTLKAGAWGENHGRRAVYVVDPSGEKELAKLISFGNKDENAGGDKNASLWQDVNVIFKTGEAGNYKIGFDGNYEYNAASQNQTGYGDIVLVKSTAMPDLEAELEKANALAERNVGDAAFQIPADAEAVTTLKDAIEKAQGVYDNPQDDASADAAAVELQTAEEAYEGAYTAIELNKPAEGEVFNIINVSANYDHAGKALTFKSAKDAEVKNNNIAMAWSELPGSIYPQDVTFEAVEGETNTYKLSYTRADGTKIYVATGKSAGVSGGNDNNIRATAGEGAADRALNVKVAISDKENVWYLHNTESSNKRLGGNGKNDANLFTGEANGYLYYDMQLSPAAKHEVTVNLSDNYATLVVPFEAEIPEGLEVYSIANAEAVGENGVLTLTTEESIKANTPYVVYGSEDTTVAGYGVAYTTTETFTNGLLTGSYYAFNVPANSYVLQTQDVQAFYKAESELTGTPYRAYLTYEAPVTGGGDEDGHGIKAFYFNFADSDATAIKAVPEVAEGAEKVFYNLAGQRVANPTKGIYIVNGQKVLVK